ncbi:cytochrome P450 86B1-like [Phoenix dactylifera]|uniref:Cytochrome P450 86B1 n=1 Tax=Phoenix dactylifera TaxID=42345 RepID=A0A8B8ZWU6_PHODC|nr:cytochrome P450 86B1 [Phoenix dactylifera]XP_038978780.1 cytochrome P450 86B1-like [Phoenix dactylifera]XP_038979273.1 cytochrome P450 86B1-like [Phoenix dactylifera]
MELMLQAFWSEITNNLRISDVAVVALALFVLSATARRLTEKGPMMWPVLGAIPTLFFHLSNVYDWATDAIARAGGTFPYRGMWFGGAHGVITVEPANIEYMLKIRFSNFPKGRYYRERFGDFLGDGIFNADDQGWRAQRRAATAEMHSGRFAEYSAETVRELVNRRLLVLLDRLSAAGQSVDLQDVFLRFTFDNICTAAFGVDPGCLAVDLPVIPFAKAFEQATELTLFRFIVPPFVWKIMKHLDVGSEKRLKVAIRTVHTFAEKTVSDRRAELRKLKGLDKRSDLLSRLMEAGVKEGGHGGMECNFSDKLLKDFCISFILAGRDTSSVALAWFFWLLHQHPQVEERILDEISETIKRRQDEVCRPDDNIVFTVEELKRMEYLQAALSESLRLYPSVPLDFKEVLEDDILPDGSVVKKGARVFYSIYSMARMERIWGKDCREFRPERWIKDGILVTESQFKYTVFNAGPRLCVGKKFAYMQMKMVAASILLRYRVEVVEGQEVKPKLTTTLYMKNGLRVTFSRREGLATLQ